MFTEETLVYPSRPICLATEAYHMPNDAENISELIRQSKKVKEVRSEINLIAVTFNNDCCLLCDPLTEFLTEDGYYVWPKRGVCTFTFDRCRSLHITDVEPIYNRPPTKLYTFPLPNYVVQTSEYDDELIVVRDAPYA